MTEPVKKFDIVIVGGGLSGCLSALAFAQLSNENNQPLSIAVVESNPVLENVELNFDSRVLALSHGSAQYLNSLGIWSAIKPHASPIETIHISDKGAYGKARIYANEHDVDALGYVVEMSILGNALVQALKAFSHISWYTPERVENIQWFQSHVDISLSSEKCLQANLLLACDGGQSKCRQFANIDNTEKSYQQSAVIANIKMAKPHQNIAYERFTKTGPLAMLPLAEGRGESAKCSLVWTLTPEQADQIMALSDKEFSKALFREFGSWLGEVEQVGQRAKYPLSLVKAQEQVYHRMVLVGNASHTIHPIAGQGFNLGLRDVSQLTTVIENNLTSGINLADFASLSLYAERRASDHRHVISLTDSLVTMFSNQLPPLVLGRNIGLKVLNYCALLKERFVSKTMGY